MTDPLEGLREPVTPVDPDPGFAGRLRQRLTREVFASPFASPGGAMSQQAASQQGASRQEASQRVPAAQVEREPAWPPALTPYIMVSDARRALDWYAEVLGAQPRGEHHVNADGTIGHAELGIGDAVLMLSEPSDLWPGIPVRAPDNPVTFSHTLHLQVDDVDETTERARRAGASVEREPADQPYGRGSVIIDPFGHRWMLLRPPAGATRMRQGDVANVTMTAPDARQAMEFYEAVLKVPFPETHPGMWRATEITPPLGIMPSQGARPEVTLTFRVDDIAAAVQRARLAGGQAGDPRQQPFGLLAECADNQGVKFRLWQPSS